MPSPRPSSVVCATLALIMVLYTDSSARGASGDLLLEASFQGLAPEGITHDPTDNSFWVPSYLDGVVRHFDANLNFLGSFPNPFLVNGFTGIAYYPPNDSLLLVEPAAGRLLEVDKNGAPVPGGIDANLQLFPVVNPMGIPFIRGLAYYPNGNGGDGSVFGVENVGSLIYEFDLFGSVLRTFGHPDDPDGFPGLGAGAPAGGIDLVLDPGTGDLIGFDLIGEDAGALVAYRLDADGVPTGLAVPLASTGTGAIGGIVRVPYTDPTLGVVDAIYGTAESSAALFIVDGALPPIAEILDFTCEATGSDAIELSWTINQTYEEIELYRNASLYAVLPGTSTSFVDTPLADGVYEYEIVGYDSTFETLPRSCVDVIGAGQVLDSVTLVDIRFALDLTEAADQTLWISDFENRVWNYDKDLEFLGVFDGPFTEPDDELSGIAYRPETSTLFLYNSFDNTFQEVDLGGTPVGSRITAELPIDPDDDPFVGSLLYNPNGNGGDGELFALELETTRVYRLARDGSLLGSFLHPEEAAQPLPPSYLGHYVLGLSAVPEIGDGFVELDTGAGNIFDRTTTRIYRIDGQTGVPTGFQLPVDALYRRRPANFYAVHNTNFGTESAAYVIAVHVNDNVLFRVNRDVPTVLPVDFLSCRQPSFADEVQIEFVNHGPYDAIEIYRDEVLLANLPGDVNTYLDNTPLPGIRRYRVVPVTGGVSAAERRCELRVGVGAILERKLIFPAVSPYQMTRNPSTGEFFITSNSGSVETIYKFDQDLEFIEEIPSPVDQPFQVAALSIRNRPGGDELWSIAWELPTPWLQEPDFVLTIQDEAGGIVTSPTLIDIPGAGVGVAVTYPTGLTYDPASDTFWFLERNTNLFWQLNTDGVLLQSVPHPLPPQQDFVFNLGLSVDSELSTLTATTALPLEDKITRAVGITLDGIPTGETIPLDDADLNPIYGMARERHRLWVTGSTGSLSQLLEIKAADPVEPPSGLTCVESAPLEVTISWSESIAYDDIVVSRSGVPIAVVAAGTLSLIDTSVPVGARSYTVSGRTADGTSPPNACSLVVTGTGPTFIRGDASGDGQVDVSDAVFMLSYLFAGGPDPDCLDAADVDDNGLAEITDPVFLLAFLFTGGPQPPMPFPTAGGDPTGDSLLCD